MHDEPLVSVIIPVWRDEDALTSALEALHETSNAEVVVASVLGEQSHDRSAHQQRRRVRWISAPRGRASQMNAGAAAARGRWLLFLHADSRVPADWMEVVAQVDESSDIVAGAFRLILDSRDWRARVIETGVRVRVALFNLPYGDQALFVRRHVFNAIGGYRDLPLMEDVDLVRRLKNVGRLFQSRSAVRTSARRWEGDGWVRRSAQNFSLAASFLLGASPARLAQRYFGRKPDALVMMARAPWTGGKTRLDVSGDQEAHADLRRALFLDTLDVVRSVPGIEGIVACEPADACEQMRELVGPAVDVIPQRGTGLGARLTHVFEDVFRLGAESVVVIGSDLPDLPSRLPRDAFAALSGGTNRVVLGPAADGGYYLVGMNSAHPALLDRIDWSTDRVLPQTVDAAKSQHLSVVFLDEWADVDDAGDLDRITSDTGPPGAERTHAWIERHRRDSAR